MSQPVAFVSGAGRRFGYELSKALLSEGYRVFAHFRSSREGVDHLEQLGATALQADFSNPHDVEHLIRCLNEETDTLDLLVNNASCFHNNQTVDASLNDLLAVYQVHAVAPYILIQGLAPLLKQSSNGLVVNITDIYVDSPSTDYIAYCGAKAALANMTLGFAKTLAPKVRVNAIQPGPILFLPEHDSEHQQKILSQTPLKVEGGLQPMIDTVRYLRDNPFITGESIKVDGGRALMI